MWLARRTFLSAPPCAVVRSRTFVAAAPSLCIATSAQSRRVRSASRITQSLTALGVRPSLNFNAVAVMSRSLSHRSSSNSGIVSRSDNAAPEATSAEQASSSGERGDTEGDECYSARDQRFWWTIAGLSGATAVALGAFGAHGLKTRVSEPRFLDIWQTAAHYHLVHTFALVVAPIVVGALRRQRATTGRGVWAAFKHNIGLGGRAKNKLATAATAAVARLPKYGNWSARCFALGTLVFSGSLYALVLTENPKLGAITPLGGVALIAGWILLAIGL